MNKKLFQGWIGEKILDITTPLIEKKNPILGPLLIHWDKIVDPQISLFCYPEKISYKTSKSATLHIRVWGSKALEIQYKSLFLLERINSYFGYQAIDHLSWQNR